MRKVLIFFICLAIFLFLASCGESGEFTETENKTIVAADGTKYDYVGNEYDVWCFGEWEFIGYVKGEKEKFVHKTAKIKTGMYSVNGNKDILVRYFPDNEFVAIYVKSELLKKEVALDNCIRFEFVKASLFNDDKTVISNAGITECGRFLDEITNGEYAKDAGLYDLVRQSDGMLKNCYVYGYICGILQDDLNLVIPLEVISFDDKAYSITIYDKEYVLPQKWVDELTNR